MKFKIDKLPDTEINSYLVSRNFSFNKNKMINKTKIDKLNHYIWWFTSERTNFRMTIDKNKKIYLWQKSVLINKKKYLIGGWHSNIKKINLFYVLYFLKWQLKYNKLKKIDQNWVAVVKKNNRWILRLTKYLGYKIVNKIDKEYKVIKKIFNVGNKKFYFLFLEIK